MVNQENQQKNHLSLLKRALLTIERLQAKISALEQAKIDSLTDYLLQDIYPIVDDNNSFTTFSLSHQNYKQREENIEALSDEEIEKLLLKTIEALEEI